MHVKDAINHRNDMAASMEDVYVQAMTTSTLASILSMNIPELQKFTDKNRKRGEEAFTLLQGALRVGDTYWVSEQMTQFARIAASEFDEDERLNVDHLPSDNGVLFFEHSVDGTDVRGDSFPVDAVLWRRMGKSVFIFFMVNNRIHPLGGLHTKNVGIDSVDHAPYHVTHMYATLNGVKGSIGASTMDYEAMERMRAMDQYKDVVPHDIVMNNLAALWWAVMLLMGQELVTTRQEKADRMTTKRSRRMSLKPVVTVVELRRKKYVGPKQEGTSGRKLHWRSLVKGHWKTVHTIDGLQRIYVQHYWRGPEDAPLMVSEKINALIR